MLAEPKRRTVWTLNPRGKYWSEDKNKFGQKLLESMGWREGKGLGKHEDGMQEHIKVGARCDNKGLGYKPTADDVWIENNKTYEEILAQLALHHNNSSNVEPRVSNLEEKSKKIRNRVHYHKFIKAKNLSQCTEKDLSSIFPTKNENSDIENKCVVSNSNVSKSIKETERLNDDKTFESKMSMDDYFKSKMDKLKIKSELFNKNGNTKPESERVLQIDNGLEEKSISEEQAVVTEDKSDLPVVKKMKKKSKHKDTENSNLESEETSLEMEVQKSDSIENKIKPKKNKRKKEQNLDDSVNEKELNTEIDKDLSDECSTKVSKPKKSKKQKKNHESENCNNCEEIKVEEHTTVEMSTDEKSIKDSSPKKSKKSKHKIRLPSGYEKHVLSVSDSLKNYHKICDAIAKDKVLNTTNLISLHGYGYETD